MCLLEVQNQLKEPPPCCWCESDEELAICPDAFIVFFSNKILKKPGAAAHRKVNFVLVVE